jgi:hypothetical protein
MRPLRAISLVVSFVGVAACAAPLSPETGDDVSVEDETLYTTTVVTFAADGTETVRTFTSTAAEMAAEVAAREAFLAGAPTVDDALDESGANVGAVRAEIVRDTGCDPASIWIYDRVGNTGNRICFRGEGTINLDSYRHSCIDPVSPASCSTWLGMAKSLWAGSSSGWIRSRWCNPNSIGWCDSGATIFTEWFFYNAWQRVDLLPHLSNPPRHNAWHDYVQLCAGFAWCP